MREKRIIKLKIVLYSVISLKTSYFKLKKMPKHTTIFLLYLRLVNQLL